MQQIVFLDRGNVPVTLRKPGFAHRWRDYPDTQPEELVERLSGASIAITDRVALPGWALERLPKLRLIAVAATGVDGVDLETCRGRGIAVCNVRDWALSVPEHVFALILALRRNLMGYHAAVRDGAWQRSQSYLLQLDPLPQSLAGTTLGIIGQGALGLAVGKLAEGFGMRVIFAERKGALVVRSGRVPFSEVLAQSDVLAILCPLTEESRGMVGAAELAALRKTALLINCGRGGIVDEAALASALKRGKLAGAGLDVLEQEPPRQKNPLLALQLPNLIVTPHVAWLSDQSLRHLGDQLIDNLEAFHAGTPRNIVT